MMMTMTMRRLQRDRESQYHLAYGGHDSLVCAGPAPEKRRGCCHKAIKGHSQSQGESVECTQAHMVISSGESRVRQQSETERKNWAFDGRASWFDRVSLTADGLQQEKEELCVPPVLLCVVEAWRSCRGGVEQRLTNADLQLCREDRRGEAAGGQRAPSETSRKGPLSLSRVSNPGQIWLSQLPGLGHTGHACGRCVLGGTTCPNLTCRGWQISTQSSENAGPSSSVCFSLCLKTKAAARKKASPVLDCLHGLRF